jgi:AhpD family alkylhydroperoxidase
MTTEILATDAARPFVVPATRLAVDDLAPHINRAMNALDAAARKVSLEPSLLELVRARASQINGCAYCVDMHNRDAREAGESERRLFALPVWRETPFFTARERAALELTEAVTRLSQGPVPDAVYEAAAGEFTDVELAELIWAITVINAWNRLGATARPWALT